MDEEYTAEDWKKFKETVLDDPPQEERLGRQGDRRLDQAKVGQVSEALDALQEKLLIRIPKAADRSPDTFSEEIEALNEVLELKMKLALT